MKHYDFMWGDTPEEMTIHFLKAVALKYGQKRMLDVLESRNNLMLKSDVFISIQNIIKAVKFDGNNEKEKLKALKKAVNIYNTPIFLSSSPGSPETYIIKDLPDFEEALNDLKFYEACFKTNVYNIINTIMALLISQITGYHLNNLFYKAIRHIERFIEKSENTNPSWDEEVTSEHPLFLMPIGAAGCGKSTFFNNLRNVVNMSCDNIRYLLFSEYGPCFQGWENSLSWWVVNNVTDYYIRHGYHVFYNGVNTDMEYRSPITMEIRDPFYEGVDYDIRLIYFEPPVQLNNTELKELKEIDLWKEDILKLDFSKYSKNVQNILNLIKTNYERTVERTKAIREGKAKQDPYDVLYEVPPAIVKMFVEQAFTKPTGNNVYIVPRKEISDADERNRFYAEIGKKVMS